MDAGTVAAFLAVDLLLVFTPGADWAYAITAGLRNRSIVPAVAGLVAGYAGYTVLAVAGLVVIVASSATLLTALTVLGAAYLMWLGRGVLARPATPGASTEVMAGSHRQVMLKGAGISGLNPKALLLHMVGCAVVYLTVGLLARTVLQARPAAAQAVTRASGAMMIAIGGFLLVERLAG